MDFTPVSLPSSSYLLILDRFFAFSADVAAVIRVRVLDDAIKLHSPPAPFDSKEESRAWQRGSKRDITAAAGWRRRVAGEQNPGDSPVH
jgi:hypothetical protein